MGNVYIDVCINIDHIFFLGDLYTDLRALDSCEYMACLLLSYQPSRTDGRLLQRKKEKDRFS